LGGRSIVLFELIPTGAIAVAVLGIAAAGGVSKVARHAVVTEGAPGVGCHITLIATEREKHTVSVKTNCNTGAGVYLWAKAAIKGPMPGVDLGPFLYFSKA
jgi:hypothetical protein